MNPEPIDSYGNVKIMKTEEHQLPKYIVLSPDFNEEEIKIIREPGSIVRDYKEVMRSLEHFRTSEEKEKFLREYLRVEIEKKNVSKDNIENIISSVMDEIFLGYGRIGALMRDEFLEEIMVNGVEVPVFVVHRKHGMCVTNIKFESVESINNIINWLSRYAGREINEDKPLLDAHMPDGSRANIAIPPAAPYGPAITIRKFKKLPYNIIDLISFGSISTDLAAFLWLCVEGMGISPIDMLIAGGAGSGKTTLLNALAMFIPKAERIVTVEDTLELNFEFLDNWVPLEASPAVIEKAVKIDMHTLLKNSLRMRPDRVIVGEVRGKEAETLMVAMDIGLRGSMGTIHANNARETTIRLMDEPMNVPPRMLTLIDLIIVMNRISDRRKGMIRRITQVSEISGMERDVVQMGDIYLWDMNMDRIYKTEYPIILKEKISERCGIPKKRLDSELYVREKVLQYMLENNIRDNTSVLNVFQKYHIDPKLVISEIKSKISME